MSSGTHAGHLDLPAARLARPVPALRRRPPVRGFLKMRSHCPACELVLDPYRADDAPAYFTIFAVGHIIVPLVLVFERYGNQPPLWVHAVLWFPLSVVIALILLPRIKGAVIALLWAHRIAAPKPSTTGSYDPSP